MPRSSTTLNSSSSPATRRSTRRSSLQEGPVSTSSSTNKTTRNRATSPAVTNKRRKTISGSSVSVKSPLNNSSSSSSKKSQNKKSSTTTKKNNDENNATHDVIFQKVKQMEKDNSTLLQEIQKQQRQFAADLSNKQSSMKDILDERIAQRMEKIEQDKSKKLEMFENQLSQMRQEMNRVVTTKKNKSTEVIDESSTAFLKDNKENRTLKKQALFSSSSPLQNQQHQQPKPFRSVSATAAALPKSSTKSNFKNRVITLEEVVNSKENEIVSLKQELNELKTNLFGATSSSDSGGGRKRRKIHQSSEESLVSDGTVMAKSSTSSSSTSHDFKHRLLEIKTKLDLTSNTNKELSEKVTVLEQKLQEKQNEIQKLSQHNSNVASGELQGAKQVIAKIKREHEELQIKFELQSREKESNESQLSEVASSLSEATKLYKEEKEKTLHLREQIMELRNNQATSINKECQDKINSLENTVQTLLTEKQSLLDDFELKSSEMNQILNQNHGKYKQTIDEMEQRFEREKLSEREECERKFRQEIIPNIIKEKDFVQEQHVTQLEQTISQLTQNLNLVKQQLEEKNSSHEQQIQHLLAQNQLSLQQTNNDLEKAESYILKLSENLRKKDMEIANIVAERDVAITHVTKYDQHQNDLNRKLRVLDEVRRDLHNKVLRLSGNMKVMVRVRPSIEGEGEQQSIQQTTPFRFPSICDRNINSSSTTTTITNHSSSTLDLTKKLVEMTEPYKDRGGLSQRRQKYTFGFDNVFSPSHDQLAVWLGVEPMVQSAIDGYNVCLFAYGQTGSGKTYTMLGDTNQEDKKGIIYRAVKKLFDSKDELEMSTRGATQVSIHVELVEVYNEKVRDLLSTDFQKNNAAAGARGAQGGGLKVGDSDVFGNVMVHIQKEEDILDILRIAQKRRCVKATNCNKESSRSHMLFTLHFILETEENKNDPRMNRSSKLNICDLAGSERLDKSGTSSGNLLKETRHINSSLSTLSNVIESLQAKRSHVPYRDSKLTYLLQDSLGGDSKTLALVCCNPLSSHFHESICSLRFAEKMNRVELKTKHRPSTSM